MWFGCFGMAWHGSSQPAVSAAAPTGRPRSRAAGRLVQSRVRPRPPPLVRPPLAAAVVRPAVPRLVVARLIAVPATRLPVAVPALAAAARFGAAVVLRFGAFAVLRFAVPL